MENSHYGGVSMQVIQNGYRLNVGIVLINEHRQLFWGQRVQQDSWQFPQGGLLEGESAIDAMYRELYEEIGLQKKDVRVLSETKEWFSYALPKKFIRNHSTPKVVGQKQKWFLLQLRSSEKNIKLDVAEEPEFCSWLWVNFWHPIEKVIFFKKDVYQQVLEEFNNFLEGTNFKQG